MRGLLILRPEPGASVTAQRAGEMGLAATIAPLFVTKAAPWEPPPSDKYDALLLTSANAARLAGVGLANYAWLPAYAVGAATAEAAQAAGLRIERVGKGDASAIVEQAAGDGRRRLLHLCGREHRTIERQGISIDRRVVYAADPVEALPAAALQALAAEAVPLLHSPRAAALFAALLGEQRADVDIAAISKAAAASAGHGWRRAVVAAAPDDAALLAAAARLCEEGAMPRTQGLERR